jgi:hypothetical protein
MKVGTLHQNPVIALGVYLEDSLIKITVQLDGKIMHLDYKILSDQDLLGKSVMDFLHTNIGDKYRIFRLDSSRCVD